jgi:hypothetical protein
MTGGIGVPFVIMKRLWIGLGGRSLSHWVVEGKVSLLRPFVFKSRLYLNRIVNRKKKIVV